MTFRVMCCNSRDGSPPFLSCGALIFICASHKCHLRKLMIHFVGIYMTYRESHSKTVTDFSQEISVTHTNKSCKAVSV